jgi:hypothetical protein
MNSVIYSPSKLRYESLGSSDSERSTPHLYEQEEESKNTPYYPRQNSPCNVYNEYRRQEAEEEELEEESENNPGIRTARSERGLKRLSVKVRDLVFRLKETSYKDVANRLIEELVTDEDYDESGRKLDKKSSNERKTKEEKNVRRRVYDALNVLIASGVLKKNINKNVMYEEKPENRMKGLKLVIKKKSENKRKNLSKAQYIKEQVLQNKRQRLKEVRERLNALQTLITRNKADHESMKREDRLTSQEITETIQDCKKSGQEEFVEKIHFPLLVVKTPKTKDNRVNICYTGQKNGVVMSFKKQFSVMGDMDVLFQLGMHK